MALRVWAQERSRAGRRPAGRTWAPKRGCSRTWGAWHNDLSKPPAVSAGGAGLKVSEDLHHWQGCSWWGHSMGMGAEGQRLPGPALDGLPGGGGSGEAPVHLDPGPAPASPGAWRVLEDSYTSAGVSVPGTEWALHRDPVSGQERGGEVSSPGAHVGPGLWLPGLGKATGPRGLCRGQHRRSVHLAARAGGEPPLKGQAHHVQRHPKPRGLLSH